MPKTKGNELVDAEVKFISIVPKGANKIPLKIKKNAEGKSVMDLNSLFSQGTDNLCVTKVIVNKSADLDEAKELISLSGFSVEEQEDADGVVIFKQDDAPENAKTCFMKLDDDIAVEVTVNKGFTSSNYQESSFKELFSQEGVLPSINTMLMVLGDAIGNILFDQEMTDKDDAAKAVKKTIAEFQAMVVELISGVPVTAFKMAVQKANKKPYGDVEYADPGYQKDKKKRYPVDTVKHIKAAWSYINQGKDSDKYSSSQIASIKKKIVAAWKKMIDSKGPPSAVSKSDDQSAKDTTMTKKSEAAATEDKEVIVKEDAATEDLKEEILKGKKAKTPPKDDAEDEDADKEDAEDEDAADKGKTKAKAKKAAKDANEDDGDMGEGKNDDDADAKKKAKTKKEDAPAAEPTLADVMKALFGLGEQVTTLKTSTDEAIAKVQKDLGEVAKVAKSATETLDGLALSDEGEERVRTKKAADIWSQPLTDSGFRKPV